MSSEEDLTQGGELLSQKFEEGTLKDNESVSKKRDSALNSVQSSKKHLNGEYTDFYGEVQIKPILNNIKTKRRKNSNDKFIAASTERSSREYMSLPDINRTFPYEHPVVVKHNKRKNDPRKKLILL